MSMSIKNKRLRSVIILGSGVVLFPNALSFCLAMIIFLTQNIRISILQFIGTDFTISLAMAMLLFKLDKDGHDNQCL